MITMLEGLEVLFLYVVGQVFSIVANFLVLHVIAQWREEEGMKQSPFRFVLYTIEWISRFWWWLRIIGCASELIILCMVMLKGSVLKRVVIVVSIVYIKNSRHFVKNVKEVVSVRMEI
jgi:hypothetical protein